MTDRKFEIKEHYTFDDLVALLALLRSPEGCSWDRAQDHHSIRTCLLEECYEALEGIDNDDPALLGEELGDLLLQVVFHARISEEKGGFSIDEVADGVCKKMVRRHPHVFGNEKADTPGIVRESWEEIKKKEKGTSSVHENMERVAKTLPSLIRTQKLLSKAEKGGFAEPCSNPGDERQLMKDYFDLCARANALGVSLEEMAYRANGEYIKTIAKKEEEKK